MPKVLRRMASPLRVVRSPLCLEYSNELSHVLSCEEAVKEIEVSDSLESSVLLIITFVTVFQTLPYM
jgi:hypothetical protein